MRDFMTELLIIKPSSLGDIVHGLQVATSLKAQVEKLRISWVVREIFAPIVRACEAVDQVYVFRAQCGAKGFLRLMKELRQTKFDYVFDMQGLLRTGLMTSRALAKRKVGRSDAREWSGMFYDEKVPLPPDGRRSHALDILLQFCPVLGAKPELRGKLKFREVDKLNLSFAEGRGGTKPIVMFPDSRRAEKCWGGFKQLTEMHPARRQEPQGGLGGQQLRARSQALPPAQFFNLTGNTSLVSLPALMKRADWVIANDSGPMHLAAALGVKVLGIFGPTDPRLFGPYPLTAPSNVVVQAPVGDLKLLSAKEVYARFQRARARFAKSRFLPLFSPCSIRNSSVNRPTSCGRPLPRNTSTSISTPCSRSTRPGARCWRGRAAARPAEGGEHRDGGAAEGLAGVHRQGAEMKAVSAQVKEREAQLKEWRKSSGRPCSSCRTCRTRACRRGARRRTTWFSTHGDTTRSSAARDAALGDSRLRETVRFRPRREGHRRGFPVSMSATAPLVRALLHFFLDEDGKAGYTRSTRRSS
jgi:heptosyltransferase-1